MILRRLLPLRMVLAMRVRGLKLAPARNALGQALLPLSAKTKRCNLSIREYPHLPPRQSFRGRSLALACAYELNQSFNVLEMVVIADNALPMIGNTVLLVAFKAVQQGFDAISFCKHSKPIGLYF